MLGDHYHHHASSIIRPLSITDDNAAHVCTYTFCCLYLIIQIKIYHLELKIVQNQHFNYTNTNLELHTSTVFITAYFALRTTHYKSTSTAILNIHNIWDYSDVILYKTFTSAMLEVCNVIITHLSTFTNCCVRNCIRSANIPWHKMFLLSRNLTHSLMMLSVPPTWRRGFVLSSETSPPAPHALLCTERHGVTVTNDLLLTWALIQHLGDWDAINQLVPCTHMKSRSRGFRYASLARYTL